MITGIVVALPEEVASLTARKMRRGDTLLISDKLLLACSGAGSLNAHNAAQKLIAQGATRLISWGCAAALSPNLKPGALTLVGQLLTADKQTIDITSEWRTFAQQLLTQNIPLANGSLLESKTLVAAAEAKRALHAQTQAIVLDMESVAVARVAQQQQLPFLAIRAIADPVDMSLPRAISYALNAEGDVQLGKLLFFIALHPSEIPGLIKLSLHFKAANTTLKTAAVHLDQIIAFNNPTSVNHA